MTGFLDLRGEAFRTDPHGVLRGLREADWRAETDLGTAVLRFDEVQAVLSSWSLRTEPADALPGLDGAEHHRVRRSVGRAFTARRVEGFRSEAGFLADELIDGLGGSIDFVADFARPFALRALCRFVGVPEELREWAASEELGDDVIGDLLDQRRRTPVDDLLSSLVDQSLTEAESRSLVVTLLVAGRRTVECQLSAGVAAFLEHPEQWRLLAEDSALAGATAEEVVRFSPAALVGLPRVAKEDIVLNGVTLPAGSRVLPVTGSANRDAAVFSRPDRLDITVARTAHLTYGGGIHYCLGAGLARVELQEVLPRLARAWPGMRGNGDVEWSPPADAVHGPTALPLSVE
jgi:cytochrome P450